MHKLVLVGGLLAVLVACSNGGNAVIRAAPSSGDGSPPPVGTTSQLPPSIGGTPSGAAVANLPYSFTPSAADPYGAALTFSVQNAPSWASFNNATGELFGTPTNADVGTFSNISVSVSDGARTASLAQFLIVVTDNGRGSASLTWAPPTFNTDDTALTNLARYRIYYGNHANALTQTILVTNAGATDYVVGNLSPGTWYFAISAISSANTESTKSAVTTTAVM
jgi:Putative Ig domain